MTRDPRKCTSAKALLEDEFSHAGFAVKEGGRFRTMRTRYFILHKGCLYYFKDFKSNKEQGAFCILGYSIEEDTDIDIHSIKLRCPGKQAFYFVVSTKEEKEHWISKLHHEIDRISADGRESVDGGKPVDYDYAYQPHRPVIEEQHNYEKTDSIEGFDQPSNYKFTTKNIKYNSPNVYAEGPPPAVPQRDERLGKPKIKAHEQNKMFDTPRITSLIPPSNKYAMPPSAFPKSPVHAKRNPPVPAKPKPLISTKPSVKAKPILPVSKMSPFTAPGMNVVHEENFQKLQRTMKQRSRGPQGYEVNELKGNDDSSSSDCDSEGYLDLEGGGEHISKNLNTGSALLRKRPMGCSFKSEPKELYEEPIMHISSGSDASVLPASVFQDSLNRTGSEDILKGVQKNGMYLIRTGRTGLQVVTVHAEGECKHYQIFDKDGDKYLKEEEPHFEKLADLIRYYYAHKLPTCPHKLVLPYS